MSYLGIIKLEANLTIYANTHTPATGAAVDADAAPGFRCYEDETGTPLLTGSMALLDDVNTTGFYSEQIAVTAANGFEAGKSYCVRVTGVVGGVTGVSVHQFDVTTRNMDDLAIQTSVDDLESRLTAVRAGYLDNLTSLDAAVSSRAVAGDLMGLANDAITLSKFDESTAFPLVASDAGVTQVARVGADGDTMETLSDQLDLQATLAICTEARLAELDAANIPADVDSILVDTTEIGVAGAGLTALGDARLGNLDAAVSTRAATGADGDTLETLSDQIDGAALQTSVDDLETRLTAVRAGYLDNLTNLDAAVTTRAVAGDLMGLVDDAITLSKFDESTAFPLAASDAGVTQVARVGADGDTLETLSDQIDGAALQTSVDDLEGRLTAVRAGYLDNLTNLDTAVSTRAATGADGDTLETLSDQIDGVSTLDAAGVRTAVGLAAANLDTQLGALPTDAENADAVWDEVLAGHAAVGSAGAALAAAGGAGDPWATPLPGAYVAGTAGYLMGINLDVPLSTCCSHGAGAITFVYTLISSVDGTPIDNADVWVTTDIAGANAIASGVTDLAGQVTFYLDAGTLYFWRQKDGWTFDNPDTEVVV